MCSKEETTSLLNNRVVEIDNISYFKISIRKKFIATKFVKLDWKISTIKSKTDHIKFYCKMYNCTDMCEFIQHDN